MEGVFVDQLGDQVLIHSGSVDFYGGKSERAKWLPVMKKIADKHGVMVETEGGQYGSKAWFEITTPTWKGETHHREQMEKVKAADAEFIQLLADRGVTTSAT
jgi:hypothetical protein